MTTQNLIETRTRLRGRTWVLLALLCSLWSSCDSADSETGQAGGGEDGAGDGKGDDLRVGNRTVRSDEWFQMNEGSLNAALAAVEARESAVRSDPKVRNGQNPYHLFHRVDEHVRGTVLIFHGFSSRPHQMSMLADYLFKNGYNVYSLELAGQAFGPPSETWLKTQMKEPLRQEVLRIIKEKDRNALTAGVWDVITNPNAQDRMAKLMKLDLVLGNLPTRATIAGVQGEVDLREAVAVANEPLNESKESVFAAYHDSNHEEYMTQAVARLDEVAMIRGVPKAGDGAERALPIYVMGLSVGGTIALRLAEERPNVVSGVVAFAPLIQALSKAPMGADVGFINKVGPLGTYNFGWDPASLFPLGCFTAVAQFGGKTFNSAEQMTDVPAFIVSTMNEDAADNEIQRKFIQALGGEGKHHRYVFPSEAKVPHPMIHPAQVSQGMKNEYWKSLYKETLRFLVRGIVDDANMTLKNPRTESQMREEFSIPGGTADSFPEINAAP